MASIFVALATEDGAAAVLGIATALTIAERDNLSRAVWL
jgi:hypothetical protein